MVKPTCKCCEMNIYPIVNFNLCTYCYYDPECVITEEELKKVLS